MANALDIELHGATEETGSGSGEAVDMGELRSAAILRLTRTALTGTFSAKVETSPDGATGWRAVGPALSNTEVTRYHGLNRYIRTTWTLTGTEPTVTFSVSGEAHQLYLKKEEAGSKGIRPEVYENDEGADHNLVASALLDATGDAEDALQRSNALPITKVPESLKRRCADIFAYLIMKRRGFRPESFDTLIVKAYDDAQQWLLDVGAKKIRPPGLSPVAEVGVQVASGNPRRPQVFKPRLSDNWGDFG